MSKEVKLGILVTITIAAAIWGYNYIKGKNLLERSNYYYVLYDDAGGLEISAPVFVSGVKVGRVAEIGLNPGLEKPVKVTLDINWEGLKVHKDATVNIEQSLMGSVTVHIESDKQCSGPDCAKAGDTLEGELQGFLRASISEDLDNYIPNLKNEVGSIVDSLKTSILGEGGGSDIDMKALAADLQSTIANLSKLTGALANSSGSIQSSLGNVASVTENLKNQNADIDKIMSDIAAFSNNLKAVDMASVSDKTNTLLTSANATVGNLDETLESLNAQIAALAPILAKLNSEDGTLGKLINDEELYTNLNKLSVNAELLIKDLRLNPKRYAHFSLFGKKQKKYEHEDDDPSKTYIENNDGQ